jgi:hypothetical protein
MSPKETKGPNESLEKTTTDNLTANEKTAERLKQQVMEQSTSILENKNLSSIEGLKKSSE